MAENHASTSSFARWWRQVLFVPLLHSKWLTADARARLTDQVTRAERGHRGEVFLIVENHLPIQDAYHMDCRERAIDLFSEYRVWDTEENTGVLIYVNICEHQLEIVADRGISTHVSPTVWRAMCEKSSIRYQQQEDRRELGPIVG
ncbi:hypothetical protein PKHYL_07350 [Psychrobacter sp. KH172YL61]|uniref:TPM domain-containing protein n=1 Tax=Psychrobacter sp. KH172YL61 TaxID=2517899 RepID=UPI0010AF9892|nr:TPM domain-containing protein [Psychrobacter sp. KH172YL61]BBI66544.1 hypothetical protein PKHYL_07350 [Psychrobacter sp. KH172YL61]